MQLEWRPTRRRNLISLTPLIDVVFILLLFFLLASHFRRWQALRVDAAETAQTQPEEAPPPALLIRLRADGQADLDGEIMGPETLGQRLRDALRERPTLRVSIQPDPEVELQVLVALMDLVAASGVQAVTLE